MITLAELQSKIIKAIKGAWTCFKRDIVSRVIMIQKASDEFDFKNEPNNFRKFKQRCTKNVEMILK